MTGAREVALLCALLLLAYARAPVQAYNVDCNHEFIDCETELSKTTSDDEDLPSPKISSAVIESSIETEVTSSIPPTPEIIGTTKIIKSEESIQEVTEKAVKPKPRLLNINVDELQNFANALHNQTKSLEKNSKKELDLSDINLDDDDDDDLPRIGVETKPKISDKLYSNSQASSHSVLPNKGSEGIKTCKEDGISYKIGQHVDRGCEETCECVQGGAFHCSPRCKHPYVRRGRRLDDPLCFESPVDECCSIIACATGTGDAKVPKLEVCRYGNDTHTVGSKWHVGCEQTCVCEPNSAVTCTPRCKPLIPSEKCINVQDPNDVCCEVQVCDVSQDVHEEPAENVTNSTLTSSTTSEPMTVFEDYDDTPKFSMRPLVLTEPIGSIKVLHNNSVQVNLMHINNTEDPIHLQLSDDGGKTFKDVELKYSNLILNLDGGKDYILKTKETGTKFNFTITSSDVGANEVSDDNVTKVGCYHDGQYYAVGEEFRIGCSELCECTGPDMHECAALICPNHVGLELVSKGCVRWAPNPPPQPPNCCPRTARCLSDGTCHYKGIAVPNWSEVPISLTGCEQRCFCENGELDCQEVCSPLPAIPPQTLRCPPMHRPAPVNISDEDCCKEWGCLPNIADSDTSISNVFSMPEYDESEIKNFVTPIAPLLVTTITVIPAPSMSTPSLEFYKKINSIKPITKIFKTTNISKYIDKSNNSANNNITVFKFHDIDIPLKIIQPEPSLFNHHENWKLPTEGQNKAILLEPLKKTHTSINQATHSHLDTKLNFHFLKKLPQTKNLHLLNQEIQDPNGLDKKLIKPPHDFVTRVPISHVDHTNVYLPTRNNFFTPTKNSNLNSEIKYHHYSQLPARTIPTSTPNSLFIPVNDYKTSSDCNKLFKHTQCSINYDISKIKPHVTQINQLNIIKNKELNPVRKIIDDKWKKETKIHLLVEEPNPYETVLLRPLPSPDSSSIRKTELTAGPKYSSLDFERLLSQMEVESEINRNQERSADKSKADAVAGASLDFPSHPKQPPFLPTPPPEIYPQDDIPDYDQNNIHRPLEPSLHGLPPGLTIPPNYSEDNKKLIVISLVADSPTSVKMLFGLPPVLVGLRGSVDLRYTDKSDDDISRWHSQVFAPADEVLTTPRLEFRLTGLRPSTLYKIRGKLFLHNLPVEPESEIYTIRTLDLPTISPIEEKRREIDSRLTVVDVNDTSAHVSWRHFNEDELQFIDGIQVRYRPIGTPIYSMTELLHHSRSAADLHDLRPGSRYEASLVLVPPPRSATELHDPGRIEFTTSPYADPYNWSVVVEARAVGSEAAELTWRGVPSPAERWVRVYRAAHACGPPGVGTRREHDAFRLAARDQPPSITLTGLEPNTRCRVWLELFLTNGKVKTSNVLEINTKSQDEPEPIDNEIEASSIAGSRGAHHGDYYGALVVVGVVAALGALTSLLLLLVVVRRYRPRSVPITPVPTAPRESSLPPYDNPAYKLELQQETMDL